MTIQQTLWLASLAYAAGMKRAGHYYLFDWVILATDAGKRETLYSRLPSCPP